MSGVSHYRSPRNTVRWILNGVGVLVRKVTMRQDQGSVVVSLVRTDHVVRTTTRGDEVRIVHETDNAQGHPNVGQDPGVLCIDRDKTTVPQDLARILQVHMDVRLNKGARPTSDSEKSSTMERHAGYHRRQRTWTRSRTDTWRITRGCFDMLQHACLTWCLHTGLSAVVNVG
jgi:hypothetical protein